MDIVPLCLYYNRENSSSYLGYPRTGYTSSGSVVYACEPPSSNLVLVRKVYVINPDFRPIPPGAALFCAKVGNSYNTISVEKVYDTFNKDPSCVRFIAWNDPVPESIPLYLFSSSPGGGGGMQITLSRDSSGEEELPLSPIHVLPHYRNIFRIYNGRCIPSSDGKGSTLSECLVRSVTEGVIRQPGFHATLLQSTEEGREVGDIGSDSVEILVRIFLLLLLIVIMYRFYLYSRKKI